MLRVFAISISFQICFCEPLFHLFEGGSTTLYRSGSGFDFELKSKSTGLGFDEVPFLFKSQPIFSEKNAANLFMVLTKLWSPLAVRLGNSVV
jgi:hypothetical protein